MPAVKATENFERNLNDIEAFLDTVESSIAFVILLDELIDSVIPNLKRFPAMGRSFTERPGGSVETSLALEKMRGQLSEGELREYVLEDFLILYLHAGEVVYLLAIKHHRQISFDYHNRWSP